MRLILTDVYQSTESEHGSGGSFGAHLSRLLDYAVAADYDIAPQPELDTCEVSYRDKLALSDEKQLSLKAMHFPQS